MLAFLILYIYSNLFYRCIVKFNRNFALLFFLLKGGAQLLWLPRKNTTTTTAAHNTSGICKHPSSNNNNKNKVKTVVFIFRANKMRQSKIKAANGGAQMWQCVYFCQYTDLSRKHWESHALSTGDSLSQRCLNLDTENMVIFVFFQAYTKILQICETFYFIL